MAAGDIRLFSGSSHPSLAAEIAKKLGVPLGKLETKHFPCGEYYVRYGESVRGQEIFLLQTFRTNRVHDDLMELLLMIDTARPGRRSSTATALSAWRFLATAPPTKACSARP